MDTASIAELRKELQPKAPQELVEIVLRLARYKKENKELLTYLMRWVDNEDLFISQMKTELEIQFGEINRSNQYFAKKGLRKVLRYMNRFIRYSGRPETEIELRLHFCYLMKEHSDPIYTNILIGNIFRREKEKAIKKLDKVHEDLRYDYLMVIESQNL